ERRALCLVPTGWQRAQACLRIAYRAIALLWREDFPARRTRIPSPAPTACLHNNVLPRPHPLACPRAQQGPGLYEPRQLLLAGNQGQRRLDHLLRQHRLPRFAQLHLPQAPLARGVGAFPPPPSQAEHR
ncbi:hypothetical protein CALVIDRAFT_602494, partial [Calocera viscosa TUFC12733]